MTRPSRGSSERPLKGLLVVGRRAPCDTVKLRGVPKAYCYQAAAVRRAVAGVMTQGMVKTQGMLQWMIRSQAPRIPYR